MLLLASTAALLAVTLPPAKIAVVGATGKAGRACVQQLVKQGYQPRILLRHKLEGLKASPPPADAAPADVAAYLASLPGVETVKGDVTDEAACTKLLDGCAACLAMHGARRTRKLSDLWSNPEAQPTHPKQINYQGVANLIAAAKASGTCKRIVRLTGKGETPWSIFSILINGLGSMAKAWNYEGERLLRAEPEVEYTIIRPGIMRGEATDLPSSSLALGDDGADLKVTSIPHGTIAALAIESLSYENAGRSTLCAMTTEEPGTGADSWAPLLQGVAYDLRAFRTDLLGKHKLAVAVGGSGIVAALLTIALGVLTAFKAALVAAVGLLLR